MENLINEIKKILKNIFSSHDDEQYSDKTLDSGITTARTIKCYKNCKDFSCYITRYKNLQSLDSKDYIRIVVEIPCQNNLRSKNIELIMDILHRVESYFVYIDDIKLYFGDGLIHMDIYRENKFR